MKVLHLRNVSLVLIVLLLGLVIGCPPGLEITPITAIAISGTETVGESLTATPTPAAATGTYQWYNSETEDGLYLAITGATSSTYDLVAVDTGKYIKVTITGTNAYSGTVTSDASGQIANAGQLAPTGLAGEAPTSFGGSDGKITGTTAAMEYKLSSDSDYTDATVGETTGLAAGEYDVRYAAIVGYNAGAAASVDVPEFERISITAIGAISGTVMVGEELTAGTLTPSGATADYQWTVCDTVGGSYADIDGATASTYIPVVADEGKFIKVVATGTGNYSGTVTIVATVVVAEKVYVAGDTGPAGGLVFYDKGSVSDGWRYLEAAPTDIVLAGPDALHIYGYYRTDPNGSAVSVGAIATTVGTGQANTTALVNAMGSNAYEQLFYFVSISTTANYAAKLCDDFVVDTFEDWFLPSKEELDLLYDNLKSNGWGGFATTGFYWSSSEAASGSASVQMFDSGNQQNNDKSSSGHVRAIRSF